MNHKTFEFINTIAFIIHHVVDKYKGKVNKNIGEAFLMVWKFEKHLT